MIKSTTYTDDHAIEVDFDATPWFKQASPEEIIDLAECNWGGDYPADAVALFVEDQDEEVGKMFVYREIRANIETCGFECHVDEKSAMKWLRKNRPEVWQMIVNGD